MFYKIFNNLCEERKIMPETVIKDLGLSDDSSERWRRGIEPKAIDKRRIYRYFNYSEENTTMPESLEQGTTISRHEVDRLCKYLNCTPRTLVNNDIVTDETPDKDIPLLELVRSIISKISANPSYKSLQLRISSIINGTLRLCGILPETLIEIGFPEEKVYTLWEEHSSHQEDGKTVPPSFDDSKKQPYNIADIEWLLKIYPDTTLDFLLTGRNYYCNYCGCHLLYPEDRISARDDNLHNFENGAVCCRACNQLITLTNKHLCTALERKGFVDKAAIESAISNLQNYLDKLNESDAESRYALLYEPDEHRKIPYYGQKTIDLPD